jgi:glycosyltransferase involved in cell wall biosynthesis
MKILHINKFFDYNGGAEVYLHRVMEKQAEAGHEVHVFSTRSSKNVKTNDAKYFVHRFDYSKSEGLKKDAKKALAYIWNVEAKKAMTRIIKDVNPDVVHLHNVYHHLSTSILDPIRESNIHCVQTLHDLKLACPNYSMFTEGKVCERCKGGRYWNPIFHHCLSSSTTANVLAAFEMSMTKIRKSYEKTVDTFICPSKFLKDKMIEWGEPASKFKVLRNPADLSSQKASGGGGFVLYAGRLSIGKGVETLIRASARVSTLPLRIAGTGPEEERLKQLVKSLSASHITFLGFVQPNELTKIRAKADAVAVPSIQYENSPLSVLEAMGQGVPVLASKLGGNIELIKDEVEGLLAVPGDVDAWVANFQHFLSLSSEKRKEMGEKGRERIEKQHNWDGHLKGLEEIYNSKY